MASDDALRAAVLEIARRICQEQLVIGTSGNVSAREPGAARFWITPSGVDYEQLTEDGLVCVELSGKTVSGVLKPSSDTGNHLAIYRRRSDVGAVVHTHSTYATVFAVLRRELPPLLIEAAGYLGGGVPVMDFVSPNGPDFAERVAQSLGGNRALLLPNHGLIAVGETLDSALTAALLAEQSARVAYLAGLLGEPQRVPAEEIERMHRFLHTEYGQRRAASER